MKTDRCTVCRVDEGGRAPAWGGGLLLALLLALLVTLLVFGLLPATASAAITYVGANTGTSVSQQTSPASLSVTAPSGAAGDYLLAQFTFAGGSNATITGPSGWTLLNRTNQTTNVGQAIYYRVADGTSADNALFSYTRSTGSGIYLRISGGIVRYRGVDTAVTPIVVTNNNTGYDADRDADHYDRRELAGRVVLRDQQKPHVRLSHGDHRPVRDPRCD